jgi:hypothetical protein
MDHPSPAGPSPTTSLLPSNVDRDDVAGAPMRKPEAAVVPARRLADHKIGQKRLRFKHLWFLGH